MPPLHKVSIYALEEDVTQMQRLLLVYGAVETQAEKRYCRHFRRFWANVAAQRQRNCFQPKRRKGLGLNCDRRKGLGHSARAVRPKVASMA